MKKKALALAVAGALGVPALAFAQTSTVQIYGQVRVDYQYIDQGDGLEERSTGSRPTTPTSVSVAKRNSAAGCRRGSSAKAR